MLFYSWDAAQPLWLLAECCIKLFFQLSPVYRNAISSSDAFQTVSNSSDVHDLQTHSVQEAKVGLEAPRRKGRGEGGGRT